MIATKDNSITTIKNDQVGIIKQYNKTRDIQNETTNQHVQYEIMFPVGSMGLELEPVIISSERTIGCRVKDFYFGLDYNGIDPDILQSKIQIGDIITKINNSSVVSLPFNSVLEMLRASISSSKTIVFKNITASWERSYKSSTPNRQTTTTSSLLRNKENNLSIDIENNAALYTEDSLTSPLTPTALVMMQLKTTQYDNTLLPAVNNTTPDPGELIKKKKKMSVLSPRNPNIIVSTHSSSNSNSNHNEPLNSPNSFDINNKNNNTVLIDKLLTPKTNRLLKSQQQFDVLVDTSAVCGVSSQNNSFIRENISNIANDSQKINTKSSIVKDNYYHSPLKPHNHNAFNIPYSNNKKNSSSNSMILPPPPQSPLTPSAIRKLQQTHQLATTIVTSPHVKNSTTSDTINIADTLVINKEDTIQPPGQSLSNQHSELYPKTGVSHMLETVSGSIESGLVAVSNVVSSKANTLTARAEKVLALTSDSLPYYSMTEMNQVMTKKNDLLNELSISCMLLGQAEERANMSDKLQTQNQILQEKVKSLELDLHSTKCQRDSILDRHGKLEAEVLLLKAQKCNDDSVVLELQAKINAGEVKSRELEKHNQQQCLEIEHLKKIAVDASNTCKFEKHQIEEQCKHFEQLVQEKETILKSNIDKLNFIENERDMYAAEIEVLREVIDSDKRKAEAECLRLRDNMIAQQEWHTQRLVTCDTEMVNLRKEFQDLQEQSIHYEKENQDMKQVILHLKDDLTQSKLHVDNLDSLYSESKVMLQQLKEANHVLQTNLQQLELQSKEQQRSTLISESEHGMLNDKACLATLTSDALQSEINMLLRDIQRQSDEIKEKDITMLAMNSKTNNLELMLKTSNEKLNELQNEKNEIINQYKLELSTARIEYDNTCSTINTMKEEHAVLSRNYDQLSTAYHEETQAMRSHMEATSMQLQNERNVLIQQHQDQLTLISSELESTLLQLNNKSIQAETLEKQRLDYECLLNQNEIEINRMNSKAECIEVTLAQVRDEKSSIVIELEQLQNMNRELCIDIQNLKSKYDQSEQDFLQAIRLSDEMQCTLRSDLETQLNDITMKYNIQTESFQELQTKITEQTAHHQIAMQIRNEEVVRAHTELVLHQSEVQNKDSRIIFLESELSDCKQHEAILNIEIKELTVASNRQSEENIFHKNELVCMQASIQKNELEIENLQKQLNVSDSQRQAIENKSTKLFSDISTLVHLELLQFRSSLTNIKTDVKTLSDIHKNFVSIEQNKSTSVESLLAHKEIDFIRCYNENLMLTKRLQFVEQSLNSQNDAKLEIEKQLRLSQTELIVANNSKLELEKQLSLTQTELKLTNSSKLELEKQLSLTQTELIAANSAKIEIEKQLSLSQTELITDNNFRLESEKQLSMTQTELKLTNSSKLELEKQLSLTQIEHIAANSSKIEIEKQLRLLQTELRSTNSLKLEIEKQLSLSQTELITAKSSNLELEKQLSLSQTELRSTNSLKLELENRLCLLQTELIAVNKRYEIDCNTLKTKLEVAEAENISSKDSLQSEILAIHQQLEQNIQNNETDKLKYEQDCELLKLKLNHSEEARLEWKQKSDSLMQKLNDSLLLAENEKIALNTLHASQLKKLEIELDKRLSLELLSMEETYKQNEFQIELKHKALIDNLMKQNDGKFKTLNSTHHEELKNLELEFIELKKMQKNRFLLLHDQHNNDSVALTNALKAITSLQKNIEERNHDIGSLRDSLVNTETSADLLKTQLNHVTAQYHDSLNKVQNELNASNLALSNKAELVSALQSDLKHANNTLEKQNISIKELMNDIENHIERNTKTKHELDICMQLKTSIEKKCQEHIHKIDEMRLILSSQTDALTLAESRESEYHNHRMKLEHMLTEADNKYKKLYIQYKEGVERVAIAQRDRNDVCVAELQMKHQEMTHTINNLQISLKKKNEELSWLHKHVTDLLESTITPKKSKSNTQRNMFFNNNNDDDDDVIIDKENILKDSTSLHSKSSIFNNENDNTLSFVFDDQKTEEYSYWYNEVIESSLEMYELIMNSCNVLQTYSNHKHFEIESIIALLQKYCMDISVKHTKLHDILIKNPFITQTEIIQLNPAHKYYSIPIINTQLADTSQLSIQQHIEQSLPNKEVIHHNNNRKEETSNNLVHCVNTSFQENIQSNASENEIITLSSGQVEDTDNVRFGDSSIVCTSLEDLLVSLATAATTTTTSKNFINENKKNDNINNNGETNIREPIYKEVLNSIPEKLISYSVVDNINQTRNAKNLQVCNTSSNILANASDLVSLINNINIDNHQLTTYPNNYNISTHHSDLKVLIQDIQHSQNNSNDNSFESTASSTDIFNVSAESNISNSSNISDDDDEPLFHYFIDKINN